MERQAIMRTYVLHEHTFSCQLGKYPLEGEELMDTSQRSRLSFVLAFFAVAGPIPLVGGQRGRRLAKRLLKLS
jgi:hypothetical protein